MDQMKKVDWPFDNELMEEDGDDKVKAKNPPADKNTAKVKDDKGQQWESGCVQQVVTAAAAACGEEANDDSTDSGNVTEARLMSGSRNIHHMDDGVSYKIGDLGHVVSADSTSHPEEGDCRYMAPELLMEKIRRKFLFKADVFSLGLSMYEAASLVDLPKNSLEDHMYEHYKAGLLPPIEGYSKDFNALIRTMVNPDPLLRP